LHLSLYLQYNYAMSTDIYTLQNYKEILRLQLKEQQKKNHSLSLRKIASLISIQYTYLSKVMNHDEHHLNEDHLFSICKILSLPLQETEYVLNLRSWAMAQDSDRKKYLLGKLQNMRRDKKLNVSQKESDSQKLALEMSYLLNPLCIVVHVAASNPLLRKNIQQLCPKLGISLKQLKEILKILALNDLIELESDQLTIQSSKQMQFHLGRNHPLMRVHQNLMKSSLLNRLSQTDEEQKQSFMVTFTSNQEAFESIKDEFQNFLKKVESIARKTERPQDHQQVYHMNFDFFRWI
jgi:uncharacterized protein (TIGR02147 family)